ncbi:MAG: TadE/TadG family type IV pilus assembly protein [Vicinamibacterales bacterium]
MKRATKSERGAELIEFALVFPLLLFVVLGIVDFGFLFQRLEVVTNASREGARIAVLPNYTTADVECRIADYIRAGGVPTTPINGCLSTTSNPAVTVAPAAIPLAGPATIPGKTVTVTFTHNYLFIGGLASWFGGGSFSTVPVTGVATMRDEIPVPAGS